MPGTIELHAFMEMAELFRRRQWPNPHSFPLESETTGLALLTELGIAHGEVEVMFVNRKAFAADCAIIHPGDRVALVPPGVPGPHRFLLGFKNR